MAIAKPVPLYPTYVELRDFTASEYPGISVHLLSGPDWWQQHWQWGFDFLLYIGRNKSEHTYIRFRSEIEKFILWSQLIKNKPVDDYRKTDILEYADFCWQPPLNWISLVSNDRFYLQNGFFQSNTKWLPYRLKQTGNQPAKEIDKKRYKPSQQTLTSTFTAITAFYKYLMNEELCYGNPAQIAKKDCRHFITDVQVKEVRRLNSDQWQYVLDTALELADQNQQYERSLFIVASLKTLFLRISELSERQQWSPEMGHFWEDENQNWWLKVYGKGRKLRDITVPEDFLPFLRRYRLSRGLPPYPSPDDNSALVEKIRGRGGMTARHLSRLVQEIFEFSYVKMKKDQGEMKARRLQQASTHWLRHTGASMEIERGRALKDLSEDLGHASMATTDTIYVQTENKKRAASGKNRKV